MNETKFSSIKLVSSPLRPAFLAFAFPLRPLAISDSFPLSGGSFAIPMSAPAIPSRIPCLRVRGECLQQRRCGEMKWGEVRWGGKRRGEERVGGFGCKEAKNERQTEARIAPPPPSSSVSGKVGGGTSRTRGERGRLLAIVMQDRGMHGILAMPRYDSPGTRVPRNTIPARATIFQGLCARLLASRQLLELGFHRRKSSIPENTQPPSKCLATDCSTKVLATRRCIRASYDKI